MKERTSPVRSEPGSKQDGSRSAPESFNRLFFSTSALILFLLALAFRTAYLLEYRHSPFWCLLSGDPQLYHERALEILKGDFLGKGVSFHSSPLYPYFLALIYRLAGVSIPAVFIVQSILGSLDVVLAGTLARLLFGRAAFWLAGAALALWPTLAYLNAEQLEITLVLLGTHTTLLLLIWDRVREDAGRPGGPESARPNRSTRRLFLAGLALGLAVLGKPNTSLFLLAWFLWEWRRAGGARPLRSAFRRVLPLALGVACTVLPFTLRNLVVNHDLVLTSANGGINLYIGNNASATGIFAVPTVLQGDLYRSSSRVAENALGRPLKASEVSAYWSRQATAWIAGHPLSCLALTGRKLLLLVNGLEISNHFDPNFLARDIAVARTSPFRFALWIPFAFWGISLTLRRLRRREKGSALFPIPLLWLLAYSVSLLPFFMTARYRIPIVPTMVAFSAYGALDLYRRAREKRFDSGFAAGILVVAAGLALTHLPLNRAEAFYFNQYQILAAGARDQGDLPKAVEYYTKAVTLEPRSVIAHNSLGNCLARLGRTAEAETQLLEATRLDPSFPQAWRNLAAVRHTEGRSSEEREALETAVRLDPRFAEARSDLVRRLIEDRDYQTAVDRLDAGLKLDPGDRQALWNRALLLGQFLGRKGEALRTLDQLDAIQGPTARTAELRRRFTGS